MKRLFSILLLTSCVTLVSAQDDIHELAHRESLSAQNFSNRVMTTTGSSYDIKYHRFNWYIDPAFKSISGSVFTTFSVTGSTLSTVSFDLDSALTVDSVIYNQSQLTFNHSLDVVTANLLVQLVTGDVASIEIYYHGNPSSSGFGSFNQTVHNGTSILWTLSEPFGASDWWPCKNSLTDKIDSIDVIVETPSAYKVASNGILLSETISGANTIFHWSSKYPISTYLVAFAVTNYERYSDYVPRAGGGFTQVLNYVYPEDTVTAKALTPSIINTIMLYDSLLIEYPFADEKYGHAQFGWGGGMEHQTMSFVVNYNHPLLAHECAHQWFGDYITCGSWEDIWLNEGFATYMEGITEQYLFPTTWMTWKQNKIANITSQPSGSVKCTDTTNISRIFSGRLTYNKGAYLLHMLRWKLGDALFFQSLRNYLNDPQLKFGFAKTPDLIQHLQNTSGQNLSVFFNQWYYQQGFPSYQLIHSFDNLGNTVSLQISQTTSDPSVSFFEMPLPVRFTGNGFDTTITFNHTYSGQLFSAVLPAVYDSVFFDPELWILSANNSVVTGIPAINASDPFAHIFPNPTRNELTVELNKTENGLNKQLFIDDMSGKQFMHKTFSSDNTKINVSALPSGNYILRIISGEKSMIKQIFIQH